MDEHGRAQKKKGLPGFFAVLRSNCANLAHFLVRVKPRKPAANKFYLT